MDLLVEAALKARENAWAPFSNFKVGAALEDDSGRIHTGCNRNRNGENVVYHESGTGNHTDCRRNQFGCNHVSAAADIPAAGQDSSRGKSGSADNIRIVRNYDRIHILRQHG